MGKAIIPRRSGRRTRSRIDVNIRGGMGAVQIEVPANTKHYFHGYAEEQTAPAQMTLSIPRPNVGYLEYPGTGKMVV